MILEINDLIKDKCRSLCAVPTGSGLFHLLQKDLETLQIFQDVNLEVTEDALPLHIYNILPRSDMLAIRPASGGKILDVHCFITTYTEWTKKGSHDQWLEVILDHKGHRIEIYKNPL